MSRDELHSTVESIGERFSLGEYEIEAYLTVLEHGSLTASDLATRTDIPQPRVYDTVRSLGDRGLVELRESRPLTVVAVDPEDAFESFQESFDQLLLELESRYTAPANEAEAVSLVTSAPTIRRYFEDVITTATHELALSLTPALLSQFEDELESARAGGITIDLVVTPGTEAPDPDEYSYDRLATAVRTRRGVTTPLLAVADGAYSIYATQSALRQQRDRYAVIFNRSALGNLVSGFFDTVLWRTSDRLVESTDDERSFPRTYASVRRCVEAVIERGGEWYATVDGRDVETGEQRRVSGRVSDLSVELDPKIASFRIETDDGTIAIGGRVATVEDVEAGRIRIGRSEPPTFSEP